MRITIPRSLGWAHVVGTLQTQTCGWLSPDPCSDAVISIDLTWHATGPVQSTPPSTVRFAGDDSDPSCLTHLGRFTSRPATVSGSIPELGPLGDVLAGRAGIGTDSFTYVGDANSCPD
jgi:hypothetical protein